MINKKMLLAFMGLLLMVTTGTVYANACDEAAISCAIPGNGDCPSLANSCKAGNDIRVAVGSPEYHTYMCTFASDLSRYPNAPAYRKVYEIYVAACNAGGGSSTDFVTPTAPVKPAQEGKLGPSISPATTMNFVTNTDKPATTMGFVTPATTAQVDAAGDTSGVCYEDLVSGHFRDGINKSNAHYFNSLNIFNLPCLSDQSVSILKEVFGNALNTFENGVTVPNGYLIPEFLRHFNEILLTLVIAIYSFIMMVGTLHSAHEGTFLGKDWSSIWTPIRAIGGPLLIVPGKYGLCGAQMIVLYFLLLGVNMGTALWAKSVQDVDIGVSPTVPTAMFGQIKDAAGQSILSAAVADILNGGNVVNEKEDNFIDVARQDIPLANVKDGILFDDVKKSMMNLCMAAYAVSPKLDTASYGNPVSNVGQLPDQERTEAQSCLNNVQTMFAQGPSAYSSSSTISNMPYFSKMVESYSATDHAAWIALIGDDMRNWDTSCSQDSGDTCFPPVRFKATVQGAGYACPHLDGYAGTTTSSSGGMKCAQGVILDGGNGTWNRIQSWASFVMACNKATNGKPDPIAGSNQFMIDKNVTCNYDATVTANDSSHIDFFVWGHSADYSPKKLNGYREIKTYQIPDASSPEVTGSNLSTAPLTWGHYADASGLLLKGIPAATNGMVALSGEVAFSPPDGISDPKSLAYSLNDAMNTFITNYVINNLCNIGVTGADPKQTNNCMDISAVTSKVVEAAEQAMQDAADKNNKQLSSSDSSDTTNQNIVHVDAHSTFTKGCDESLMIINPDTGSVTFKDGTTDAQKEACKLVNVGISTSTSTDGKLSDTSGPSIDAIDTRMDSSWWYAGQVYLQLDQQMADNLGQLNSNLQQLDASSSAPHFFVNMTAKTKLFVAHDPMGYDHLGGDPMLAGAAKFAQTVPTSTITGYDARYSATTTDDGPLFDHVAFEEPTYHYGSGQELTGWDSDVATLTHCPGFRKLGSEQQSALLGYLPEVPSAERLPLQVMARSQLYQSGDATQQSTGLQSLYRLLTIMNYNGFLQGPSQAATDLPAKTLMDKMLSNLLGGSAGQTGADIGGIMDEVYSFGNVSMSGGSNLVGKNLSVITGAQRVGVDTILTVISSMESIYDHFKVQTQQTEDEIKTSQEITLAVTGSISVANIALGAADMVGSTFYHDSGMTSALAGVSQLAVGFEQFTVAVKVLEATNKMSQQLMYLPLVLVIMTMLFAVGVTFALMLPLTPFILFWGGQMAWILGCIEAIVAAPLLALALTHPGGHQMWGHSIQGLKMLMGVVFRPVLMVMGILIAMVLTYILITISAQGFHLVSSAIIGGVALDGSTLPGMIPDALDPSHEVKGIISLFLLFIYSQFIMKAFNKCFSAIYILPEKVMQYVGGQADRAGADDLQELSGNVNQMTQQVGSAGGQGLQSGIQGKQQNMQSTGQTGMEKLGSGGESIGGMGSAKGKYKKLQDKQKQKELERDGGGK